MEFYSYAWVYFVPFVLVSSFVVMNVVVGIVVNAISEVTAANLDEEAVDEKTEAPASNKELLMEIRSLKDQLNRLEKSLEKAK